MSHAIPHLVSCKEFDKLVTDHQRAHPLVAMDRQVLVNTTSAVSYVVEANSGWLEKARQRVVLGESMTDASAALAEIRAFGALLEAGLKVAAGPKIPDSKSRPDFEASANDGSVIVEVNAPQVDDHQRAALAARKTAPIHGASDSADHGGPAASLKIAFCEVEVVPTGIPDPTKPTDSVLTNTISKIASIKNSDSQVDPDKPFVLWVDLQDPAVWGLPPSTQLFAPYSTEPRDGVVTCGPFWYALYGQQGEPMLDQVAGMPKRITMLHDGRFVGPKASKGISAVVFSLPCATILMENPSPTKPLPAGFRRAMLRTPWFRLDRSVCEWERDLVQGIVDLHRRSAAAFLKSLLP